MKLLNERAQMREVVGLYRRQYPNPEFRMFDGRRAGDILAALKSLDPETATTSDVADAGAPGWVAPKKCHECGENTWDAVELGEPMDYDSSTATICERCLMKALELVWGARLADARKAYRDEIARALGAWMDQNAPPETP